VSSASRIIRVQGSPDFQATDHSRRHNCQRARAQEPEADPQRGHQNIEAISTASADAADLIASAGVAEVCRSRE
jgi:hypothetical protein